MTEFEYANENNLNLILVSFLSQTVKTRFDYSLIGIESAGPERVIHTKSDGTTYATNMKIVIAPVSGSGLYGRATIYYNSIDLNSFSNSIAYVPSDANYELKDVLTTIANQLSIQAYIQNSATGNYEPITIKADDIVNYSIGANDSVITIEANPTSYLFYGTATLKRSLDPINVPNVNGLTGFDSFKKLVVNTLVNQTGYSFNTETTMFSAPFTMIDPNGNYNTCVRLSFRAVDGFYSSVDFTYTRYDIHDLLDGRTYKYNGDLTIEPALNLINSNLSEPINQINLSQVNLTNNEMTITMAEGHPTYFGEAKIYFNV